MLATMPPHPAASTLMGVVIGDTHGRRHPAQATPAATRTRRAPSCEPGSPTDSDGA